ncbi:glycoside hydrolase family 88 protein [Streptomyces sp. NPDC001340]
MEISRRSVLTTAAAALYAVPTTAAQAAEQTPTSVVRTLRAAADPAIGKLRTVAPGVTAFPVGTKAEKWVYSQNGDWVGGFWPGTLWMAWLHSGDDTFRTLALDSAKRLAPRQTDTTTHDLGFLMDTMMNLDLLAFASEQTGDGKYLDIAAEHANTAQRVFPRPDGSTPHVYDFDPATGTPIGPNTVQGYSPTSCWARGQAWGIYGFTTIHRRTGDQQFLTTARRLADYALGALTPDHVPVWDYRAPQQPYDVKDASAGAIMACGLLDLSAATGRPEYREAALRLLTTLAKTCLTRNSTRAEAVVARCARNRPAEDGIEISLPYADYSFLEGILRVLQPQDIDRAIDLSGAK